MTVTALNKTQEQWARVMDTHSGYRLHWGPTNVDRFAGDPKRIAFFYSRYKFAGKMLRRCRSILDVGCGDGSGTVSFLNDTEAAAISGVDFEPKSIAYARDELMPMFHTLRPGDARRLRFAQGDFLSGMWFGFDGISCLDVIEHIERERAGEFIATMAGALDAYGVAVIGTPSLAGEAFASVHSKAGHINLYDPDRLRAELEAKFSRVLLFSMNDEMVHTGFDKLAHYLIAVCVK